MHVALKPLEKIRIRLSRIRMGRKRQPAYHINVATSYSRRDGKFLERVGWYDSVPDENRIKHMTLDFDRVKHWLAHGAEPTERVAKLLGIVKALFHALFC